MSRTSELNKKLKAVSQRFGTHVGNYAYVRQQFPDILRPSGLVKGGTGYIMSYKEALSRLQRAKSPLDIDTSYFTRDYYEQEVLKFYESYTDSFSVRSVYKKERQRLEKIVEDSFEYMGSSISASKLKSYSYDELLEAVRQANEWYSEHKRDYGNSPTFYERVVQYLESGNGDIEAQ